MLSGKKNNKPGKPVQSHENQTWDFLLQKNRPLIKSQTRRKAGEYEFAFIAEPPLAIYKGRGCPFASPQQESPSSDLFQCPNHGAYRPENGRHPARNFNIYNFPLHSAGCLGETKKHLRKTIRHLEKTTKHLEKIIRQVVPPSPGLFFGKSGQKETEEALF